MITSWRVIADPTLYSDLRYADISAVEGIFPRAYLDNAQTPNPTIGIGFNLRDNDVRGAAFVAMGIDAQNPSLSAAQQVAEQNYIDQLVSAINSSYSTGQDATLRARLDAIMLARASDPLLSSVAYISGRTLFDMSLQEVDNAFASVVQRKEAVVDAWLAGIPNSEERLALVSLAYNGLIGERRDASGNFLGYKSPALRQAILNDDRAEAWFQIRYNSNAADDAGIAKRRLFEADTFGLYSAGVTDASTISDQEAKGVFSMYTRHRGAINDSESRFGRNGTSGDQVAAANRDYVLTLDPVGYWDQESQFARSYLTTTYVANKGIGTTIDGEVLVGSDAPPALAVSETLTGTTKNDLLLGEGGTDRLQGFAGTDVLYGGSGNDRLEGGSDADVLFGEAGFDHLDGGSGADELHGGDNSDVLEGGLDNDLLRGGAGNDTYYWNTGDGNDRIEDAVGRDLIVADQQILVGGIHTGTDPVNTFRSLDGKYNYEFSGTGDLIVHVGSNTLTVNEDFQSGQFGIRLIDATEANYANGYGSFTNFYGAEDNVVLINGFINNTLFLDGGNDTAFGERGNDVLYGEAGADYLQGESGHDRLFGGDGNDTLVGDADFSDRSPTFNFGTDAIYGDDLLDGGAGNDTLWGYWGDDLLVGGEGDDLLYGDAFVPQETFTADDYLDGGPGDDELHGLNGDDVLVGGDGHDVLAGELGNDVLDGGPGDDLLLAWYGQDTLAGGSGVDTLYGDRDDDILDGGSEADTLYGGDGSDILYGSAGADFLYGDGLNNAVEASLAGAADVLFGGAGNDWLEGGIGDDTLFGEADHDVLFGEAGADSLFGDAGMDELQGGADNDLLAGGTEDDRLKGDDGADQLFGDEGEDLLVGDAGDDLLEGGAGNDTLLGGAGSDTYVFTLGDGVDTIDDPSTGNVLAFGTGISSEDLSLGLGSLLIRVGDGGDAIHLQGFDPANPAAFSGRFSFQFADGTVLTTDQLLARGFDLIGTPFNDILEGGEVYTRIFGQDGHDFLLAGSGANLLDGGAGNDTLYGQGGADTLLGGSGDDFLDGGDGADSLAGGEGQDQLLGGAGAGDRSSARVVARGARALVPA